MSTSRRRQPFEQRRTMPKAVSPLAATRLRLTSARRGADRRMRRVHFVGLLALAVLTASCEADSASAPSVDHPCLIAEGSRDEELLQATLRAERFKDEWFKTTEKLVQRLEEDLRKMKPRSSTVSMGVCDYIPEPKHGSDRVAIEISWTSPGASDHGGVPPEDYRHYTVSGVPAEATDIIARFRVACRLPGDLGAVSKNALLRATLANTLNVGRKDAEAQKQQIAFLYVMARRVTDALGCENKPLRGEPVVRSVEG
ncbi:hypothetical protein RND61_04245 [Streptomyces sp. TRM76323]|uniref:Lipoprotein n=1 Tax=Streptomyces tamarix TaxID=3078565 RepID=A0ABU3QET1_9ACTN|nr:hypothetical protein [Streptomyces tamarix]MDT9681286.1 hypothetical protein [Streptomyces tamarix]